jgi:hypothetical protein
MNKIRSKIRNADKIQYRNKNEEFTIDDKRYIYADSITKVRAKSLCPQKIIKDKQIKDAIKILPDTFCCFHSFKRFGYLRKYNPDNPGYKRAQIFDKNNFGRIKTIEKCVSTPKTSIKRKVK